METHPLDRAADVVGSYAELARRLGVTRGAVWQWKPSQDNPDARVPMHHCLAIERMTRELGSPVVCEEFWPDKDWAVLRENPDKAAA